jgi:hypothetical protein
VPTTTRNKKGRDRSRPFAIRMNSGTMQSDLPMPLWMLRFARKDG